VAAAYPQIGRCAATACHWVNQMEVAQLVLPVFAIIVTGWLAGGLGYISRSLADGLVHFAYNIAMPALLFVTIAQETLSAEQR
jgi:predicted permease